MMEPTLTAEDLTLYALGLLPAEDVTRVENMLRASTEARKELSNIRGDLAMFAMAATQHTPPALTRQRLVKQVARERRVLPIEVGARELNTATPAAQTFAPDPVEPAQLHTQPNASVDPQPASHTFPSRIQQRTAGLTRESARAERSASVLRETTSTKAPARWSREMRDAEATAPVELSSGGFVAEQQTLEAEPQIFTRDSPNPLTSASARSVTMFEQHFAGESANRIPEPEIPADPDVLPYRRQRRDEAVESVADRFTPSTAQAEAVPFRSYRERDDDSSSRNRVLRFFAWGGWLAAAAAAVAAAVALRDDFSLREQVSQQQSSLSAANASAARGEAVLQTLQSTAAQRFLLARADSAPAPTARVVYLPERGTLVFQGNNLETLQPYKTYELWLIPAGEGHAPIPAGTFKPDGRGFASLILPPLPKGVVAGNFGVTIEDDGGSATPTLPILLSGAQA